MKLVWIKLRLDIFRTVKMKLIRRMRQGNSLALMWVRMQLLAGQINDSGRIYLTSKRPLTAKELAILFDKTQTFMEKALDLYEEMEMIQRDEKGFIQIINWDEDQETERVNQIREANRRRVAAYRQRQRDTGNAHETHMHPVSDDQETLPELEPEADLPADEDTGTDNAPIPHEKDRQDNQQNHQQVNQESKDEPADSQCREALSRPYGKENMPVNADGGKKHIPLNCPSVRHYQQKCGLPSPKVARELAEAEQYYGEEIVCRAIDIAKANGVANILYIQGILNNGGSIQVEKETYDERQRRDDQELDEMFRKAEEFSRSHMDGNSHEIAS